MDHESKRVEFKPPEGFKPPENVEEGKPWDMVCSFQSKPDGTICMTKLGDHDMPGYGTKADHDEDDHAKRPPDYSEMSRSMIGEMGAGNPSGGEGNPTSY